MFFAFCCLQRGNNLPRRVRQTMDERVAFFRVAEAGARRSQAA